jgi:hypothetical protein
VSGVRLQDGTLGICRLMVHPRAHRRGIATALLDALDRAGPAWRAVVSTGTASHPAPGLYQRRGFTPAGTRLIAPGTSPYAPGAAQHATGRSARLEALPRRRSSEVVTGQPDYHPYRCGATWPGLRRPGPGNPDAAQPAGRGNRRATPAPIAM